MRKKRAIKLEAKLYVHDPEGGFEKGDLDLPLDQGLLDSLFEIRISRLNGIRLIYGSEMLDLGVNAKTVKLSQILALRDKVQLRRGGQDARDKITTALGL